MRQYRKILDGAVYHVTARTNNKGMLLGTPFSRELFLKILSNAKEKFDFEIDNFVIMGNHFHLLIRPLNGSTLPEIMKWILGVYTMSYNRIHGTWGHFWGSRYFSRPVTSFVEYNVVFNYIDNNPVKSQLVENKLRWEWSGIHHHQCGRNDIVSPPSPLMKLGSDPTNKSLVKRAELKYHNYMISQETLQKVVDRIVAISHPQKIILFGSYARKDMTSNSDIDLLVIQKNISNKMQEVINIKRELLSNEYSIDLILLSEEEFERKLAEGWTLFQNVSTEGVVLYVA